MTFEEFAYRADSESTTLKTSSSSNAGNGVTSRIPQRRRILVSDDDDDGKDDDDNCLQINSDSKMSDLPRAMASSSSGLKLNKKPIPVYTKRNGLADNNDWLDARSGGAITSLDKKKNILNAQLQRKKSSAPAVGSSSSSMSAIINKVGFKSERNSSYGDGLKDTPFKSSKPIKKVARTFIVDDDESIEDPTPEKTPSSFNRWHSHSKAKGPSSHLIQEVREMEVKENIIMQKEAQRKQAREMRLLQRTQLAGKKSAPSEDAVMEVVVLDDASPPSKRPAPTLQEKIFGSDSSDDSDSDSDPDNQSDCEDFDEDLDDEKRRLAAEKVLEICENLSANLRNSLQRWEKGDQGSPSDSDLNTTKTCVDLTSIKTSSDSSPSSVLLRNEDVMQLCPGLELKAYQLVGVNWLKLLHQNKVNGVLADDMGLGKTIQTISFLAWLKYDAAIRAPDEIRRPHFIVVPASTLANWQNEFAKFCPSFVVSTYHGTQRERAEMRIELRESIEEGEVDVILSTYTIFERESGKPDRSFLMSQQFEYLVLDEAHCIKNSSSSRFSALNALNSSNRLLLSGTPVQNDLKELLALLRFLMPAVFTQSKCALLISEFGWDSTSSTAAPRKKRKQSAPVVLASPSDSSGLAYEQQFFKLKGMLAPFVLRRLKGDVLDQLSDKVAVVERLVMTPFQRQVYDGILSGYAERKEVRKAKVREQIALDEVMDCKSKKKREHANDGKKKMKRTAKAGGGATLELSWKGTPSPQQGTIDLTSGGSDMKPKDSTNDIVDLSNETASPDVTVKVDPGEVEALVKAMNASEVNHLFTALRKAANHPLLLRIRYKDEQVLNKIAMIAYNQGHFGDQCDFKRVREEIDSMSDFDLHLLCLEYPDSLGAHRLDSSALYDSPKMMLLRKLLPKLISEGHRMLVFSQWTRILDLLEVLLEDMELDYLRLDGSTPIRERQEMIDLFSSCNNQVSPASPSECTSSSSSSSSSTSKKQGRGGTGRGTSIPIFLLSTKAGGLGINLTAADTVIMHDLDFNPENDRQAEDRCHRIGQNKTVTVYRLVALDTVDEDIFEIGEEKRKLTQAVLSEDAQGRSRPSGSGAEEGDTISKILQRALLRRRVSKEEATG